MSVCKALLAGSILALAALNAGSQASAYTTAHTTGSLSAVLLGGNECDGVAPPVGPLCRKGDPDGFGRATITFPAFGLICVTLQVDNLAGVTAAHIHEGRETVSGPLRVLLPPPVAPFDGNPGASSACVAVSVLLQFSMRINPAGFYINIHNAAFPGGAIRGQLF
jgi:hypothetical protein